MKKLYLMCVWAVLLLSIPVISYAQKTISGNVKDATGQALPGVSVLERGTKNGTATNGNGDFSISVAPAAVLRISLIGYKAQEVTVGDRATVNVTLQEDNEQLSEVVVTTGFGVRQQTR